MSIIVRYTSAPKKVNLLRKNTIAHYVNKPKIVRKDLFLDRVGLLNTDGETLLNTDGSTLFNTGA